MQRAENKNPSICLGAEFGEIHEIDCRSRINPLRNQFKRSNTDLCKIKQMYSLYVFKTRALK